MADTEDKISVRCACGDTHEFARQHVGRVARCPKVNRRFRVPERDSTAVFLDEAGPSANSNESTPPESEGDSPSVGVGGRLVKRVTDLYDTHRQRRELHKQTHCRCPHCHAENLTAEFMCAKCGCPLHDQQQAFLFMEKRRQEAHELKVARGGGAHPPATPPRLEHGHVPQAPSVNVHMPTRTSSLGVVSLILGVVAFLFCWIPLLGMLSIPLSALGLLLAAIGFVVALVRRGSGIGYPIGGGVVSGLALAIGMAQVAAVSGVATAIDESQRQQTRTNQEVVASASPSRQERPATERPPAPESTGDHKAAEPEWAAGESADKQEVMQTWVLEIEALKLYQTSRSHAAIDMRFINSSPNRIQHWSIDLEVYDNRGNYLGRGEGMVSHIDVGQSKVEQILILDTQASRIGRWKATLGGVVGYSGLREDSKYDLSVKE